MEDSQWKAKFECFGDKIIIVDVNGKPTIVTVRTTAAAILLEVYVQHDDMNIREQKMSTVKTAAMLTENHLSSTVALLFKWQLTVQNHIHFLLVAFQRIWGFFLPRKRMHWR